MKRVILFILPLFSLLSCNKQHMREIQSLNGEWGIAKTTGDLPTSFEATTPVPGLVDLSTIPLDTANTLYSEGWYWHQRHFTLQDSNYDKIDLKIYKAKYHTKVYLNGHFVGENFFCFTPSYFDLKPYLLPPGQSNEIIIGVGCKSQLPDTIPDGTDYEKIKYIPGIYDDVEIILSNKPYINNIQCVPNIQQEKLHVVVELDIDKPTAYIPIEYDVIELVSKKNVTSASIQPELITDKTGTKISFDIPMKEAHLWSPEDPFLYELSLKTAGDNKNVRFGMRSFRIDPEKKIALLNEKPYYIRGTNVCIFRFFEDPERGTLPWDDEWVLSLHQKFKDMNWDAMRYCIGFPPERWYELCDSLGFLLQDEYPLWTPKAHVKSDHLAQEYTRWMRERWNHPSVVIWDSQNELVTDETYHAIKKVRHLDLSDRPWENGWSTPVRDSDPCESHPYLFWFYNTRGETEEGYKKELFSVVRGLDNDVNQHTGRMDNPYPNPSLINEYGWLWLNRNGSPTTLTEKIYDVLWDSSNITAEERLEIYARHLALLTEYWRAHRKALGILHFCGLGYSRPDPPRGQTSDHWIDSKNLLFEPSFYKYVKSSFSPVGLMIDTWEKSYPANKEITVPIYVINDLDSTFRQEVEVMIYNTEGLISSYKKKANTEPYQVEIIPFTITLPSTVGNYEMKAKITCKGNDVFSLRDICIQ